VGEVHITDGTEVLDKGLYKIPAGEKLVLQTPGGGGFGDPSKREKQAVRRDLAHGLISENAAKTIYQLDLNQREET